MRLGILASHPVQYQVPWFRGLAKEVDLQVLFAHRPNAAQQGEGFGNAFKWDVDLFSGYQHRYLKNVSGNPSTSRFGGCDTPEIGDLVRSEGFDVFIVSGWQLKCYWQAVRVCRKIRVPVLVRGDSQLGTPRSPLKRWVKEVLYRWMLRQFDGFLCVGQRNREYLLHYGVHKERLFPAPHFVDSQWFSERAETGRQQRRRIREGWGAGEEDLVALFVGKFIPEKRIEDFISGLTLAKQCEVRILGVLVGSGPLESDIFHRVEQLGIPVYFAGFKNQQELPEVYAAADVLVLPSISETWGLVVNEAMACGLPVITSDVVGCAPDLVEEGHTGFTFPVGNTGVLAHRLQAIAEMRHQGFDFSPALRVKLQTYSLQAAIAGTLRAIEQLAATHLARRDGHCDTGACHGRI